MLSPGTVNAPLEGQPVVEATVSVAPVLAPAARAWVPLTVVEKPPKVMAPEVVELIAPLSWLSAISVLGRTAADGT